MAGIKQIYRLQNKQPFARWLYKVKGKILLRLYNGFLETYTPIDLNRFKINDKTRW